MLIDLFPCGYNFFSVFFWHPEPMRIVRALPTERFISANESNPCFICSLLLQRSYFGHIMKAFTEIINFSRARGQGRNVLPHTWSPESTRDLLLDSECNIKQKIKYLLRNDIAEVLFTLFTRGCTHPAAVVGSASRQSWVMQSIFQMFAQWRIAIRGSRATVFRK